MQVSTKQKYKIMLAKFPGDEREHPDSSGFITKVYHQLMGEPRVSNVTPYRKSDTPITMSRNHAVKTAMDMGIDYLLMIDSDVGPDYLVGYDPTAKPFWDSSWKFLMDRRDREAAIRFENAEYEPNSKEEDAWILREHAREAAPCCIAAPYCGKPPHENVFVFLWRSHQTNHPDPDHYLSQFTREEAAQRGGIEEVAALPTGLILYDMRIFNVLPPPWFEYEYKDPPFNTEKSTTEDVYQTRNQSLLRMPCYCNWDSWCVHNKIKPVGKPHTLKVDQIHKSLVDAVLLGHKTGEQLRYVEFDDQSRPQVRQD